MLLPPCIFALAAASALLSLVFAGIAVWHGLRLDQHRNGKD